MLRYSKLYIYFQDIFEYKERSDEKSIVSLISFFQVKIIFLTPFLLYVANLIDYYVFIVSFNQ